MVDDSLADAAAHLYGVVPGVFTAARNEAAARAPDRAAAAAIKALRKPSSAAWVVNALARAPGARLAEALALAEELREAQDDLDAAALSRLNRERRALVAALARDGAEMARERGVTVSPATAADVEKTLNAAMRDAGAAAAVRSGRLVRALEASGLDPVDLEGAVGGGLDASAASARAERGPHGAQPARPARDDLADRRARRAAEKAAREAGRAAAEAERELARAEARVGAARERAELLADRVDALQRELNRVRGDADAARREVDELDVRHRDAASAASATAQQAEVAKRTLEQL